MRRRKSHRNRQSHSGIAKLRGNPASWHSTAGDTFRSAKLGIMLALDPMNALTTPRQRSRPAYGLAATLVIAAGLFWRSGLLPLPSFLAKYGGDSLWALVVFFGLGCVFRRSSTARIALGTICIAWSVEFFQLYHAPWIDVIRSTRLGRLVLGASFNSPDLIAYVIGAAIGAVAECLYRKKDQGASGRHPVD